MGCAKEQGSLLEAFLLVRENDDDGRFSGFFESGGIRQLPFDGAVSECHSLYQGIGRTEIRLGYRRTGFPENPADFRVLIPQHFL